MDNCAHVVLAAGQDEGSGLGVVACAGASGETGLRNGNVQRVVDIRALDGRRVKRHLIVGASVGDATREQPGNIPATQHQAAVVDGDDLKAEIGDPDALGTGDAVQELLIAKGLFQGFGSPQWIDVVDGNVRLPQLGGNRNDQTEE